MEKSYNAFLFAQKQFDKAADLLELNSSTREFLRIPIREFHFTIPVRMDDGTRKVFKAFRIVHNNARGPAKGGIRFHPMETVDTIRAMSMWMTWKTSVADIPLGGSKGGVICDPHHLSMYEQEQISRGWVRQIVESIGPHIDIPAPEMMTNSQHMIWMLDEFEKITGVKAPGAFTGKPISLGGSYGRKEASGYGVMITIREALKELNIKPMNTTASFQGFGNVAQHAIDLYQKMGGITKYVSYWDNEDQKSYTVKKDKGIRLKELQKITDTFGGIDKLKAQELGYEILPGDAWLEQDVDILVPAAIENQLTEDNVDRIHANVKIIAEGANGPTTPDADEILNKREILVLPDFLTNAGGVICSYFEQVQNNMNYYWSKDEVLAKLDEKMSTAYASVSDFAKEHSLNMREAAYVISVDRVVEACRIRGWI